MTTTGFCAARAGFMARCVIMTTLTALVAGNAWSQSTGAYPNKPIRLIVPFGTGGFADISGRLYAQHLAAAWGQSVVVDNRPGGGGILATDIAAKSAPDGYTLYFVSDGPLVINPFIYKSLPYDPVNDFTPIAMVGATTQMLAVNPEKVKAATLREFIAEARSRAAKPMTFSSSGLASPHQLYMENLKVLTGMELIHVPYKGGAFALQALTAGEVDAGFVNHERSVSLAKAGKLRLLGFGGATRSAIAPELPTVSEQGVPGFQANPWIAIVVPRATPKPIADKLETESVRIARDPAYQKQLFNIGGDPLPMDAAEFRERLRADLQMYGKLIKSLNIPMQ